MQAQTHKSHESFFKDLCFRMNAESRSLPSSTRSLRHNRKPSAQSPKCSAPSRTFFPWALSLKPYISFEASLRLGRLGSWEALNPKLHALRFAGVHDLKEVGGPGSQRGSVLKLVRVRGSVVRGFFATQAGFRRVLGRSGFRVVEAFVLALKFIILNPEP